MGIEKMNESESLMTYRNKLGVVKTRKDHIFWDESAGSLNCCAGDNRYEGGMISIQALTWNVGTCRCNDKGKSQMDKTIRMNTNVQHRGGIFRSSDEVFVTNMERREDVNRPEETDNSTMRRNC